MSRKGHWMQTFTGRMYWPVDPSPDEVDIADIAHHLSMLCRYTGAVRKFYSIAEHSVIVSSMVSRKNALAGLLHDATETYLNDLNRPLKHSPGMHGYRIIEKRNWLVIAEKFGLEPELPKEVHLADAHILFHEQAALMGPTPNGVEWGMGLPRPKKLRPELIRAWSPERAEMRFMRVFEELTK